MVINFNEMEMTATKNMLGGEKEVFLAVSNDGVNKILKGKLMSIDNDVTASQDGKETFFKSKISVDTPYLISSKGNKVNISNGMAVEARIIYDELSYFDYFLESIGILTRD